MCDPSGNRGYSRGPRPTGYRSDSPSPKSACNCYTSAVFWLATPQERRTEIMAVTDTIKDAAYVTIGLGVLGFQKAQVRRVELTKQFEEQVKALEGQVAEGRKVATDLAAQIEGIVAPVR